MIAVRIRRRLDSEILNLPELRPLIGKEIELIVLSEEDSSTVVQAPDKSSEDIRRRALHGTLIKDEDPFGPATT